MADMLSRLHAIGTVDLSLVHGGRDGHHGVQRTMELLRSVNPDTTVTVEEATGSDCVVSDIVLHALEEEDTEDILTALKAKLVCLR